MSAEGKITLSQHKRQIIRIGGAVLLAILAGAYAVGALSIDDFKVSLVLLAAPLTVGVLLVKEAPRLLLALLVLCLSFSARFRFGNAEFYPGAEASLAALDFPLLGLLFLWLVELCLSKRRSRVRITTMAVAFLLYAIAHVPSLVLAPDPGLALLELIRLFKMAILILVIVHYVQSRTNLAIVLGTLFASAILQGVLAAGQWLSGSTLGLGFLGERETFWVIASGTTSFGRAGGTLGHANALAIFFEMVVPLALAIYLSRTRGWLRLLSLGALGAGSVGLVLTFSRAGWGALVIGLACVVLMTFFVPGRQRRMALRYAPLVLAFVAILGFAFRDAILERLALYGSSSWLVRTGTYQVGWNMIESNPIWGVGANNYLVVSTDYLPMDMASVFASTPVHNILLLTTAEMGLVGLVAFLLVILSIARRVRNLVRANIHPFSPIAIGIGAGIAAFLAHAMLDWLFRYDPIYTLFWFNVGLLIATGNIALKESRTQRNAARKNASCESCIEDVLN
jgi:putative inorganic carbon (HCO3(-)) transporter